MLKNPSQKTYNILKGHAIILVKKKDQKEVWCFFIRMDKVKALKFKILTKAIKKTDQII